MLAFASAVRRPIEEAFIIRFRALDDTLFPRLSAASEELIGQEILTVLWPDRDVSDALVRELTALATTHAANGVAPALYARAAEAFDWALADTLGERYVRSNGGPSLQQRVGERSALLVAVLQRALQRASRG